MLPAAFRHTFESMDPERQETYERIPWEALESRRRDPNKTVMIVAAAVAVGALAFSFTRNQPIAPTPEAVAPTTVTVGSVAPVPSTVASPPMVVAEADLYAVEEDLLVDVARAHAEWFAVEYLAFDGSEASRQTLASLLPAGVPVPEAPAGTQVFVDWAGSTAVTEVAPTIYQVEVIVRSLVSGADGAFVRQSPRRLFVEVALGPDGSPRVTRPPQTVVSDTAEPEEMALQTVPEALRAELEATVGTVVGGEAMADGSWRVVVMAVDPDGVTRPRTVLVPGY